MEKTIKEIKENAKTLENDILKLISDFEVANPEVEINVSVKRNYYAKDEEATHDVNCTITIK